MMSGREKEAMDAARDMWENVSNKALILQLIDHALDLLVPVTPSGSLVQLL